MLVDSLRRRRLRRKSFVLQYQNLPVDFDIAIQKLGLSSCLLVVSGCVPLWMVMAQALIPDSGQLDMYRVNRSSVHFWVT